MVSGNSVRHQSLSVEIGVGVAMRDGTRQAADVYKPSGAGRWPVVLLRTPYDRRLGAAHGQQVNATRLAAAGYAVVIQDVRGRFGSEGAFYPFRDEAGDGFDTISWAAEQPWSTGAVGLVGSSYAGYNQVLTAKQGHPALQAWVPAFAPLDARRGWAYEGEAFCLGFNLSWALGAIGARDRRTTDPAALVAALDDWPATVRRPPPDQPELAATPAGRFFFDWLERRDNAAYWEPLGGRGVGSCPAPAAQIGGWFDLFALGSFELHDELAGGVAGGRHRFVVGPWDHAPLPLGTGAGETDFGGAAAFDLVAAQQRWFDWLLRGESEPDWPAVRAFVTGWNRWETWSTWPPPHRAEAWFLHPDGSLAPTLPASGEHPFLTDTDDPTPTVGGRLCCAPFRMRSGQLDQVGRAARPDVRSYASPLLDRDLLVGGPVRAEIWSTSSVPTADLHVTLVDVGPEGRALYVADGIARRDDLGGDPAPFAVELGHVGHAFRAGHRPRIDVAGMSFPRFDRAPGQGQARRIIALDGPTASRIVLPIAR